MYIKAAGSAAQIADIAAVSAVDASLIPALISQLNLVDSGSHAPRKLARNNICVGKAAQERKMTANSCFRSKSDQTGNKKGERP
jgi:hypothetical protein